MSGVLDVLWSIRVGNVGPMNLMMFLSKSEAKQSPIRSVEE